MKVGDRVLIRNTETGGPGKIRSYWEQDVYIVLAEKGNQGVVLEARKESVSKARRRVIHSNMLLLVDPQYGRDHDQRADVGPVMETSHQSHERSLFVLENLMMNVNLMTHNRIQLKRLASLHSNLHIIKQAGKQYVKL